MRLPSLDPGLVWSPPETRWPNRLTASAWAAPPSEPACALVVPTETTPGTSTAVADASPGGAGVDVTVLEPPEVANAATPSGTDMSGVRASTTVARRTDLRIAPPLHSPAPARAHRPDRPRSLPALAAHLPGVTGSKHIVNSQIRSPPGRF